MLTAAMLCMALNVYHEARSEPLAGQAAIALVTMNRVAHSGLDVCQVVYQRKQFSWTNDRFITYTMKVGKKTVHIETTKLDPEWVAEYLHPKDTKAWLIAKAVAESVMGGYIRNFLGPDVRFYHADYVNPLWRKEKQYIMTVGSHLFYTNKKASNDIFGTVPAISAIHNPSPSCPVRPGYGGARLGSQTINATVRSCKGAA